MQRRSRPVEALEVIPDETAKRGEVRPKKGFNWAGFLIESAIAIAIFNIVAAIVTWYFILPRLKH